MISREDLFLLLGDLEEKGINTNKYIQKIISTNDIDIETIQFINSTRRLDLCNFYEKLRKSYNEKKSKLYINIVKENFTNLDNILTTLSSLLTQILLYSKQVEDREMFLRHSRADEIVKVLEIYFNTYNYDKCIQLLKIIKCDLKLLEESK